jgi:apolipoprotein N-acyltransferase
MDPQPSASAGGWGGSTLLWAMSGALLLFAAFPPLNLWPLAWLAPVPWIVLIRLPKLPGKRPYLAIWGAGFLFWLLMLQGIRLAHPALYAGWLALAWYLAFYLPVFVALSRVAVQRLRISVVVAAPVVWVGLELLRGHLLTGVSLGLIAHTQVAWPAVLQIADLAGAYAVSFVMLLVAACVARMIPLACLPIYKPSSNNAAASDATIPEIAPGSLPPRDANRPTVWPAFAAICVLLVVLGYGYFRLGETVPGAAGPGVRVALVQGSLDTVFDSTEEEYRNRIDNTFEHYNGLTREALAKNPAVDLVVWPESMFPIPDLTIDEGLEPTAALIAEQSRFRARLASVFRAMAAGDGVSAGEPADKPPHTRQLLFGTTTFQLGEHPTRIYNSAVLAASPEEIVGRYYKMHPVMFGEYIPFADRIPWLYTITPLTAGLAIGDGPRLFPAGPLKLSPSVCFESTVPHLIRAQVVELARRGTPADVLVNVTNDGWFKGSSILDQHFRCSVFRAIENRKPVVIAANTGFSAFIDGNGRILQQGPRRAPAVLIAEVHADGRSSRYHTIGDLPAWLCLAACGGLAVLLFWRRK